MNLAYLRGFRGFWYWKCGAFGLSQEVNLEKGIFNKYDIITPTQWNLSNGTRDNLATSQKAMIGLDDIDLAQIVFKSFDVCSVCTTH